MECQKFIQRIDSGTKEERKLFVEEAKKLDDKSLRLFVSSLKDNSLFKKVVGQNYPYFEKRLKQLPPAPPEASREFDIDEEAVKKYSFKNWYNDGFNAFYWAVDSNAIKALLEAGDVDPDEVDPDSGRTPIYGLLTNETTIDEDDYKSIKYLLESGRIDISRKTTRPGRFPKTVPMLIMGRIQSPKNVKELFDIIFNNYSFTGEDSYLLPLIITSHLDNDTKIKYVKRLLSEEAIDLTQTWGSIEGTALMMAIESGQPELAKLILETGKANVGVQNMRGKTALMMAIDGDQPEIAKLILETGEANEKAVNTHGLTALMYAIEKNQSDIAKLILETGRANTRRRNISGSTALMDAIEKNQSDIAKLILETGKANIRAKNEYGQDALMLAIVGDQSEIAKLILETGKVNVNAQNIDGGTVLMVSILRNKPEIAKLILETGKVDLKVRNEEGETALEMAINRNRPEIVDLIKATFIRKALTRKKELPRIKKGPLWMTFCRRLESRYGLSQVRKFARQVGIDTKGKSKRELCVELAKNYEELLEVEGGGEITYKHDFECKNDDGTLLGEEWDEVAPEDIFHDEFGYCFSYDDIEGIGVNGKHPYTNVPLSDVKLKSGEKLLSAFDKRRTSRNVEVDQERLKKMHQVHTEFEGDPLSIFKEKLAELIDEHSDGESRNYFDTSTLSKWQTLPKDKYKELLSSIKDLDFIKTNRNNLSELFSAKSPNFEEFLEIVSNTIENTPEEDKQTLRLNLKLLFEEVLN